MAWESVIEVYGILAEYFISICWIHFWCTATTEEMPVDRSNRIFSTSVGQSSNFMRLTAPGNNFHWLRPHYKASNIKTVNIRVEDM
jgi:hypothetical protein